MSRIKQNESVKHIMTEEVRFITPSTPLSEVGKIFSRHQFHHLPVVNGKELAGMLSFMDLMRVSFEDSFGVSEKQAVYEVLDHTLNVEAVMTKNPVTILLNHSIKEAAEILSSHSFHSLPVVDDNHELQGIVTSADLIKYLLALY